MKSLLWKMVLILAVSMVLGFVNNSTNPNKIRVQFERPETETVADSLLVQSSQKEVVVVNKQQVAELVEKGGLLLDVRLPEEFADNHIEGAANIPYELLGEYIDKVDALDKERWIITYCDGPPCEKSVLMADEFKIMGFLRIAVYYDGLEDWLKDEAADEQ